MYSENITATSYLSFNGNGKEAMNIYAKVLEGIVEFLTFKEDPIDFQKRLNK